jgi:hypothetical protein
MLAIKHTGAALLASVFMIALAVDSADARRGGGGGMRAGGGMRMGGGGFGGRGFAGRGFGGPGRAHISHPIARPGRGLAGYRPGYGYGGRYGRGYGWGVAGAAVGAGLAYSNYGGYDDSYYGGGAYAAGSSDVAYCAQRFRSYDPASQTYLAYGGRRVPCP